MRRLPSLHRKQTLLAKLKFAAVRIIHRRRAPDIMRALHYRHERFGTPFLNLLQAVMRGPSDWSLAERELFAAYVSHLNQCRF